MRSRNLFPSAVLCPHIKVKKQTLILLLFAPEVSIFQQEGKGELELAHLTLKRDYEEGTLVKFLLQEAIHFANSQKRVLVIDGGLFPKALLLKKGFSEHTLMDRTLLVYGENYHYNLKNIKPQYFSQLNPAQLSQEDFAHIENTLKKEGKAAGIDKETSKIVKEFEAEVFKLLEEANSKIKALGGNFTLSLGKSENGGLKAPEAESESAKSSVTFAELMEEADGEIYLVEDEGGWEEEQYEEIEGEEISEEEVQSLANLLDSIFSQKPDNKHRRF